MVTCFFNLSLFFMLMRTWEIFGITSPDIKTWRGVFFLTLHLLPLLHDDSKPVYSLPHRHPTLCTSHHWILHPHPPHGWTWPKYRIPSAHPDPPYGWTCPKDRTSVHPDPPHGWTSPKEGIPSAHPHPSHGWTSPKDGIPSSHSYAPRRWYAAAQPLKCCRPAVDMLPARSWYAAATRGYCSK